MNTDDVGASSFETYQLMLIKGYGVP